MDNFKQISHFRLQKDDLIFLKYLSKKNKIFQTLLLKSAILILRFLDFKKFFLHPGNIARMEEKIKKELLQK